MDGSFSQAWKPKTITKQIILEHPNKQRVSEGRSLLEGLLFFDPAQRLEIAQAEIGPTFPDPPQIIPPDKLK
jgi:hypothetical protein